MTAAGGTENPKELNSDFHFLCKCWAFSISLQFRGFSKLSQPPTNPSLFSSRSPWIWNISRGPFCCPDWEKSFTPLGWGEGTSTIPSAKGNPGARQELRQVHRRTDTLSSHGAVWIQEEPQPQSMEKTASVSP